MIDVNKLSKRQKWGSRLVGFSTWILPLMGSIVALAEQTSSTSYPIINRITEFGKDNAVWGFVVFFILLTLGKLMARPGDPTTWKAMQMHLDVMQGLACPQQHGDINDNHRVTLFKRKMFCFHKFKSSPRIWWKLIKKGQHPWSGWLVPVLRSGQTNKKTKTVFWAPDDGRSAEGIAGYCWACDDVEQAFKLPSLTKSSGARNKTKYADRTKMPEELLEDYLNRGRELPRSLMGFPLKTSAYATWGVIVIDSMSEDGIDFEAADNAFRAIAAPVSVLLEEL